MTAASPAGMQPHEPGTPENLPAAPAGHSGQSELPRQSEPGPPAVTALPAVTAPPAVPRRRAGRPSKAVLDTEQITEAALKLIELQGYKGLTMSGLARRLGVAPSALYNHVAAKADVLVLVEDHLMAGVDVGGFGSEPWDSAVRRWAWSYRDVFARHTPLIPVIAVLPVTNAPRTVTMYEAVTAGFLAEGWPQERIVDAIVALESFIFGSAYDVTAPEGIFDTGALAGTAPLFSAAVERRQAPGIPSGTADGTGDGTGGRDRTPAGAPATADRAADGRGTGAGARADVSPAGDSVTGPSDSAFALGLDALISGLAASRHGR
jgi:AcrR family transcriptional regulator